MARHNTRIKKAAVRKFEVLSENQVMGSRSMRLDLDFRKGPKIYIVDAM
jgi:hypothetical protein